MIESDYSPLRDTVVVDRSDPKPRPLEAGTTEDFSSIEPRGRRSTRRTLGHLRAIRVIMNGMLLLALMYTVTLTRSLLIPLVLAAFLGLALNPIVAADARRGLPRWLSSKVLMLALMGSLGFGVTKLAQPAMGWIRGAPVTLKDVLPKFRRVIAPFEMANRATQTLVNGAPTRGRPAEAATVAAIGPWDVLAKAPTVLAAILTVTLLVFFSGLRRHAVTAAGRDRL